ncbi:hypothetical protein WKH56_09155 [Priestia sp. SB1]|uniref:hypothetical protein n=1 Tax=Priestia sp. SB1 TaxID=3132359 RepID=UPI003178E35E
MFKKTLFMLLSFFIFFSAVGPPLVTVYAKEEAVTSKKYGTQFMGKLAFDKDSCSESYNKFYTKINDIQQDKFKFDGDDEVSGLAGKAVDMLNSIMIYIGNLVSKWIFDAACYLGFAPSQLLQVMFFPVVLENFSFIGTLSSVVSTISILVLGIVTVLAIYELNRKEGTIGEEIVSKVGMFLFAGGMIAFSGYILQGIFDIANVLGYFVSHYQVDVNIAGKEDVVPVDLLNFPTIFSTYLEFAFAPDVLNEIPGFSVGLLGVMTLVKLIVIIFMIKDLLQIAVYGLKRLITLVSSAILVPILAGLIPSYKTKDIFSQYFKTVVTSAFAPVVFGIIYLASAPFVINDMVNMISAPLLKVFILAFYLNILTAIPGYVDQLLGSYNTLGNGHKFERGMARMNLPGFFKGEAQDMHLATRNKYKEIRAADAKSGTKRSFANRATRAFASSAASHTKSKITRAGFGQQYSKDRKEAAKANRVQRVKIEQDDK